MQPTWGWGALWSFRFGGLHLGPRWPPSERVEGVEVPATSWQSQHGFPPLPGPSGDFRFDWGMAPSHVFLIMALQGPADHRAGQRGRCAPFETGLNIHQRPFFALARLSAWSAPDSSPGLQSHPEVNWLERWESLCSATTPAPMPASRARAHWSQLGCGVGLAGWLLPSTDRSTDRWLHLQQP